MTKTLVGVLLLIVLPLPAVSANRDEEDLRDLVRRAEVVAVVKLIGVDPALGLWSGYHAVVQYAKYEVEEVIKGKLPVKEVYVAHGVVHNSPIADDDKAQLSPELFKKGSRFVLFLVSEDGKDYLSRTHPPKAYFSLDERFLPKADLDTVKLIRELSGTKKAED
jgi:hypothetical protein